MSDDGWDEDDDGYGGTVDTTVTQQSFGSVGRGQSFNQMNGSTSRGRGFGFGRGRGMASRSEQDRSWRSGGDEPRVGGTKMSSDGSSLRIDVANRSLGRIIGRGGSKIRELQDSSGARINILKEEAGAEFTPVELSGNQDSQKQAQQLIEDLLQDSFGGGSRREDGGGGFGGRRDDGGGGGGLSEHIQFPNTEIRRLIGRGGSRIQAIQDGSSCRVKILNDDAGSFETPILLQGSQSAIDRAKELIKEVEEEVLEESKPKPVAAVAPAKTTGINWADLRAMREESERARFAGLPEIVKNFYIENPEVANRHPQEVEEIRKKHMNISVENLHPEGQGSIPNPCITFDECFEHFPEILSELTRSGFTSPTPIQMQGWPVALQGLDLIGIAQTGTGKTLAFLIPAFIHIEGQPVPRSKREGPTVLVLSPTRELALQIEAETKKYSYKGIQCCCVYGGGNRREQIAMVRQGVEIIVATPGRLNDLILNDVISLKAVTYLVLDEADRMLDMGFEPEIRKVLLDIRPDRQTIMTSATWPPDVRRLAESYMTNPIQVFVGSLDLAAVHSVTQIIEFLEPEEKKERLLYFLTEELGPKDKVIVFLGKKVMVDDIASDFHLAGIDCQSIHGGREQIDREQAIEDLKTGSVQILIATDVASRGLDIKDVTHVINYDFPHNMEEYVHRVGRTGRAGQKGTAITFMTRRDWRNAKGLIDILVEAEQEVPRELEDMARRFQSRLDRDRSEGGRGGGGGFRGGGGGGRGGGGFRRGGRDRNDFGGFGGDDFSSDFFGDFGGGGGGRRGRGGRRGKDSFIRNAFGVP